MADRLSTALRATCRHWRIIGLVLTLALAGCGGGAQTRPLTAADLTQTALAARPTATRTPVPTVAPSDTPTPTLTPTDTLTPTPTATVTPSRTPFRTNTPRPSPTQPIVITPTGAAVAAGGPISGQPSWTPPPLDQTLTLNDHYWFARPIPADDTTWAARNYPYGSTYNGLQVHHGIDIVNQPGTPVLAVADGTVAYAGDDIGAIFGPRPDFYGNVIVIQHDFVTADTGEPIFSLYGHLSAIEVTNGQRVVQGDQIGRVGATGVALGPHLHFEVRIGDPTDYGRTRNPELWIRPYSGYGTLAGRITDANGNILYNVPLTVVSATDPDFVRTAYSYAEGSVNGDDTFQENFVLGDLPAGYYDLALRSGVRTLYRDQVYIYPRRTTWLEVRLP